MADEEAMAGKKSKQRKDSQRRGRSSKKNAKQTVSTDDELTCNVCAETFTDISDKLLECERCGKWFCTGCIGLSEAAYQVMVERKDMHWYCSECETQAVTAVKSVKDIEDRCAVYMKTFTEWLDKMENKIDSKADIDSFTSLESRVKHLESKERNDQSSSANVEMPNPDTVRETIAEQKEREFRVKNVIIHNLPESDKVEIKDRRQDDIELVTKVFSALGVTEENPILAIERCSRIGRKEKGKKRITKVTLESVELKRKVLKNSRTLKNTEDFKEIYVGPDLTKMQRKDQCILRKELNERKDKGEHDIFISRGKIVQARDRAVQFKGGAAGQVSKK